MSQKTSFTQLLPPLALLLCLFSLLAIPQPVAAQATPPTVTYTAGTNTINIGASAGTPASQPISLAQVAAQLANPAVLAKEGDAWILKANVIVDVTAQLSITPADGVTTLRLESKFDKFVYMIVRQGGHMLFDGMTVTSWDTGTNQVDQEPTDRAYILAQDGARLDIKNSDFGYLGYLAGGNRTSGVTWLKRLNPGDPLTGATGTVENSKFHHNYQGLYISEGYALNIVGNEIHSNQLHGLFLRDGSQASKISGNTVHDNGGNGIYLYQLATGNTVENNPGVFANAGSGIALERASNNNIVNGNTVYQNVDGILVDESDGNTLQANKVSNNDNGIHVKGAVIDPAAGNKILGNTVEGSKAATGAGVYLDTHADSNEVRDNTITGSLGYGIYVKLSGGNQLTGNTISGGYRGIGIAGAAEGGTPTPPLQLAGSRNVLAGNNITANSDSGVRIEGGVANGVGVDPATGTVLTPNQITSNLGGGITIKSTSAGYPSTDNQVIGNTIVGNGKSGVEVRDSGTDRNRLSKNKITQSGGSGIKLDGIAQQGIQPPVINDILADNTVLGTAAANATIEIYSDPGGEGETLLGVATSDASGNWTFPLPSGQDSKRVTALVIDGSGNTSAFSAASGSSVEFFTSVTASPSTINVTGDGAVVTLQSIQERLGAQNTNGALLEDKGNNVWLLKANLKLEKGVTLNLNPDTVTTLQLRSQAGISGTVDYNRFVYLRTSNGVVNIDGVEIVGWDTDRNAPDTNATDGRAFIVAKFGAELNINNATLSYLGMSVGKTDERGVTWDSASAVSASGIVSTLVSGQVVNSKFHHNYVGAQVVEAGDVTFANSEFRENLLYGFYVRDNSRDIVLENSTITANGLHGVMVERGCTEIILRKNTVSANGSRGILITQGSAGGTVAPVPSTANVVDGNTVDGNRASGIHILGSNNNEVLNNVLTNNEIGVNVSDGSTGNNVHHNSASTNLKHGFQVDQTANGNTFAGNTATQNTGTGIYVLSSSNTLDSNLVTGNREQGIYLNPKDGAALQANQLISNTITGNTKSGVEITKALNTELRRNRIEGNTSHGIYLNTEAVGTKIMNNIIVGNNEYGIRVNAGSYQNAWSENSIYNNVLKGISVVLNANKDMPRPKVTAVDKGKITGSIQQRPLATIELFADANTQGRYFLGRTTADAEGKFSLAVCGAFPAGGLVAIATDSEGNSSEFSDTFLVPSNPGNGCFLYLPTIQR